jgi:serine/threonine protein phosphatase PrpC
VLPNVFCRQKQSTSDARWQAAAQALVETALVHGSPDNVSVMIIKSHVFNSL